METSTAEPHPHVPLSARVASGADLRRGLSLLGRQGGILGLAASAIAIATACTTGGPPPLALLLATFTLVLPSYGIDRIADARADERFYPERARVYRRKRRALTICYALIMATAVAAAASTGRIGPVLGVLVFPLTVVLYVIPLAPMGWRYRRVKDIPYAKGVYGALCWAGLVPFAALFLRTPMSTSLWALAAFVYVTTTITSSVCDLKDICSDRAAGVRTIATQLGVHRTVRTMRTLNVASSACALLGVAIHGLAAPLAVIAVGQGCVAEVYLARIAARRVDLRFYADVICDGAIVAWIPLALLGTAL